MNTTKYIFALCAFLATGCATITGTSNPALQQVALDSDIQQGVQVAAAAEMSNDTNSIQYFLTASEALNSLTANGNQPTLLQIDAELARVVPAKYQTAVNNATSIAEQKYQTWYTQNSASLTPTSTATYVVNAIKAARDGINAALANVPASVIASAPGVSPALVAQAAAAAAANPVSSPAPAPSLPVPVAPPLSSTLPSGSVSVSILDN